MKKLFYILLGLALVSCSGVSVSFDYSKEADFTKYSTYAFDEGIENMPLNQLDRDRFIKAVETQMAAKGFTKSDNPDMLVNVDIVAQKQVQATAHTSGTGYYGRYRYGGGFSTTSVSYDEYIDGTLIISMIDKAEETLIWQGRGTKTLDENASASKKEKNINYVVEQIFQRYPPKSK